MAYPHTFATQTGSIPLSDLDDNFAAAVNVTSGTGSALLPKGTTAQRDTSPTQGGTRFNTTNGVLEYYDGTNWQSISSQAYVSSGYAAISGSSSQTFQAASGSANADVVITSQFGNLVASSGYQDFPQGVIFQWASYTTTSGAYSTWTFPKAFPTGLLQVYGTAQSTSTANGSVLWNPSSSTKTGASVALANSANSLIAGEVSFFAIGY